MWPNVLLFRLPFLYYLVPVFVIVYWNPCIDTGIKTIPYLSFSLGGFQYVIYKLILKTQVILKSDMGERSV